MVKTMIMDVTLRVQSWERKRERESDMQKREREREDLAKVWESDSRRKHG